jgi:peptidyl-prolyl cis-trans isomerase B (cyclophilin B)
MSFARMLLGLTLVALPMASTSAGSKTSPLVRMTTNMGEIEIELNAEKAPKSVANFLEYVRSGHYNGTIFHRVIPGFMIQGGGFEPGMKQKPTNDAIENEADNGLKNDTGTIAMARTNDPHSATAQFFVNVKDNAFLNHTGKNPSGWGYAVFGKVTKGMDVVKKIETTPTGSMGPFQDVPKQDVVIEKIEIVE